MKKRLPFTPKNIIRSFSEATGLAPSKLSIDREISSSTDRCDVIVKHPAIEDRNFYEDEVAVYRDQEALDKNAAEDLQYDEDYGFYDVGDLSPEDIVRHASSGCTLSDLRHWIISEGRHQRLSDDEIKTQLRRPLETLIEYYREDDMEGAFTTLIRQCRSDMTSMSRHLIKAAGGAQKIWKRELYEEISGGFIVHLIPDEDISLFRQLTNAIKNRKHDSEN